MSTIAVRKRKLVVRLAENQYEIERALALRYEVFNIELAEGLPASRETGKDRDDYDLYCDHLIVLDEVTDRVVGTYRMLRGSVVRDSIGFYSENEFDLRRIRQLPGEAVEIGRSCVHRDFRDGSVISNLWQGIGSYIRQFNVQYLMGCGSIHTTDPDQVSEVYAFLREKDGLTEEKLRVEPLAGKRLKGFNADFRIADLKAVTKKIPPLIKGYLRAGAKICGSPALDQEFGTSDFFILFNAADITARYDKKFLSESEGR